MYQKLKLENAQSGSTQNIITQMTEGKQKPQLDFMLNEGEKSCTTTTNQIFSKKTFSQAKPFNRGAFSLQTIKT